MGEGEREREMIDSMRERDSIARDRGVERTSTVKEGETAGGGERESALEPEGVLEGAMKRASADIVQGAVLPTTSTGVMLIKETMATTWMATWTTGPLTMMGNGSK